MVFFLPVNYDMQILYTYLVFDRIRAGASQKKAVCYRAWRTPTAKVRIEAGTKRLASSHFETRIGEMARLIAVIGWVAIARACKQISVSIRQAASMTEFGN